MKHSRHSRAACLALVAALSLGCAGNPTQESAGEYIDDTWITTRVKAALIGDDQVRATEVNVETFKGAVQLSGFVTSETAMAQAMRIARGVRGVTSVENAMQLK